MNKKRLSVVMAGAMLASSVAPVLAAEEVAKSEVSASELGLFIKKVRETLESKKFANDTVEDKKINGNEAGLSVYEVKVDGKVVTTDTQEDLQDNLGALVAGQKVEIWSKGFRTETVDGVEKYYATKSAVPKYEKASELEKLETTIFGAPVDATTEKAKTQFSKLLVDGEFEATTFKYKSGTGYNEEKGVFVLDFVDDINKKGIDDIEIKVGDEEIDFNNYINADKAITPIGSDAIEVSTFLGFPKADVAPGADIAPSTVEEITIVSGGNSYELSDLYDGLMLTKKGQSLLELAKAATIAVSDDKTAVKAFDLNTDTNKAKDVTNDSTPGGAISTLVKNVKTGKYNVKVRIADSFDTAKNHEFYISATDIDDLNRVLRWLDGAHAQVDVLAGEDRYETAVKIAKETALLTALKDADGKVDGTKTKNIVLVNGDSLVDGLAAAPLAKHLAGSKANAPILLTEKDELPRATREYLIELADKSANKTITVSIVGGKGVVSNSIKSELIKLGFKVDRFGGDDREETSMAVAEVVGLKKGAFVVGATGEADAMSIAGYAAAEGMPVIVSGFEGLSEGTLDELRGVKTTVLGGNASVSEADYKELAETIGVNNVRRISGSDRKATNAAIINTFYDLGSSETPESVIVAKDDVLIDALTAANLASEQNAPLVLATNSLSSEQVNALELKAKSAKNVYQVGYGVDPTNVVKVVAQRLGLAK